MPNEPTELDKAIERGAVRLGYILGIDCRDKIIRVMREEIDPEVTVEFELPVRTWRLAPGTSARNMSADIQLAANIINRVAKRME